MASNRGPVAYTTNDGAIVPKRGSGGLVTALTTALNDMDATWVSVAMSKEDKKIASLHGSLAYPDDDDPQIRLRFINVGKEAFNSYYNLISNKLLWFCFHYLWHLADSPVLNNKHLDAWASYKKVNDIFAKTIVDELNSRNEKEKIVLIQDYHLLTMAKTLRDSGVSCKIGHFSHTSWPQADYLSIVPKNILTDIFNGLLSCDLLGFQTNKYARNFMECAGRFVNAEVDWEKKIIKYNNRVIAAKAYPVTIDSRSLLKKSAGSPVESQKKRLAEKYNGLTKILRIERADPTKNTVRGIMAYDRLLRNHPELKENVVYLCYLNPSREDVLLYKKYMKSIEAAVRDVNERHATGNWLPIDFDVRDDYDRALAALKIYDVLVINPVYDGMNLVAKEGPSINENSGVLILSENAGSFEELGKWTISVNPFDISETAEAMYRAITMDKAERRRRSEQIKVAVAKSTTKNWLLSQVNDLISNQQAQ